MAKRRWKQPKKTTDGWVYIISISINGNLHLKIGSTNRNPKVRLLEIASEIFDKIGYIPVMKIVKQQTCKHNYKVEAAILQETLKYRLPEDSIIGGISGASEIRLMGSVELENCYTRCINADQPADINEPHWLVNTGGYNGL